MVPKPNGDLCPILDPKPLNKFVHVQKYKNGAVNDCFSPEDFQALVDIKVTYLYITTSFLASQ